MLTTTARTAISQTRRLALRGISILVLPPAVALVAAVVFVALRLAFAAHGDLSRFVLAGDRFAARSAVPRDLFVFPGPGYDGQFFYRLGLNPTDMTETSAGMRIDDPLRFARPGYPLLAWLLSGAGHPAALTVTLVLVNVAALALAAFSGGLLARDAGRHPAWGLLVAGYWAVPTSLGRDLSEVTTVAALLAGLVAYRRNRYGVAAVAFSLAILTRETTALVIFAIAAVRVVRRLSDRRTSLAVIVWAGPMAVWACWQAFCYSQLGTLPALSSGDANLAFPFSGLARFADDWVRDARSAVGLLQLAQFLVLVGVLSAAAVAAARGAGLAEERLAWLLSVLLVVSLSTNVYVGPEAFRTASETFALSTVLILSRPQVGRGRAPLPGWVPSAAGVAVAAALVGEAALRIRAI